MELRMSLETDAVEPLGDFDSFFYANFERVAKTPCSSRGVMRGRPALREGLGIPQPPRPVEQRWVPAGRCAGPGRLGPVPHDVGTVVMLVPWFLISLTPLGWSNAGWILILPSSAS